jgi:predicted DNA-binding transcriptional regulator
LANPFRLKLSESPSLFTLSLEGCSGLCGLCVKSFVFLLAFDVRCLSPRLSHFWNPKMKNKKPNAALMWKQFEDLAPRMRLSIADRTVYSYLLRHGRLEGRRRIEFSLGELARGACVSLNAARPAVRRLITRGVLLLVERSKVGHVAEVRTPEEILMVQSVQVGSKPLCGTRTSDLEELDFLNHPARRRTIRWSWVVWS